MPEGLAEFFVRCMSPENGLVVDPFAGSDTTIAVGRGLGDARSVSSYMRTMQQKLFSALRLILLMMCQERLQDGLRSPITVTTDLQREEAMQAVANRAFRMEQYGLIRD